MTSDPLPRGKLKRLVDARVSLLAVAAGCAYLLQAVPGVPVWASWTTILAGALLTTATVIINRADSRRRATQLALAEEIAKQAHREATDITRTPIEAGLDAVVQLAAEKSHTARREMVRGLKQLIVGMACDIKSDARASFFYYDDSDPVRTLRWEKIWKPGTNRHHRPREEFREGDGKAGDEMFRMMKCGKTFFEPDVSKLRSELQRPERDYETYIAAPVSINGKWFGFLALDAPRPGDLDQSDANTMRVLAMILAVGLSIAG